MVIRYVLILSVSSLLISCGTTRSKMEFDPASIELKNESAKKSATIRVFTYWDFKGAREHLVTLRNDLNSESAVISALKDAAIFSEIKVENFEPDSVSFSSKDKEQQSKKIDTFLSKFLKKEVTDYYINIYLYTYQDSYHSPKIFWGFIHGLSLGLIPLWERDRVNVHIDYYNDKGVLLKTSAVTNSQSIWAWSPSLLWGGKFNWGDKSFRYKLIEGAIFESIKEGQEALRKSDGSI